MLAHYLGGALLGWLAGSITGKVREFEGDRESSRELRNTRAPRGAEIEGNGARRADIRGACLLAISLKKRRIVFR